MARIEQRRFDNQPEWVDALAALAILGVKRRTLYAYVSRGLLRSIPSGDGRTSRYSRADLDRLRTRSAARSGHAAVAAAALRWGEPVLDSSITELRPEGPHYRGQAALELAENGVSFEDVAEWLWGSLSSPLHRSQLGRAFSAPDALPQVVRPRRAPPIELMLAVVSAWALQAPSQRLSSPEVERDRARSLIRVLAATPALGNARREGRALQADSVAESFACAIGMRRPLISRARAVINQALIVSADHELNASAFAARVAASAGATLPACLSAALATLSGYDHGGACERVEDLVAEVSTPRRARSVMQQHLERGEPLSGFGHPQYPAGDPRGAFLLGAARRVAGKDRRFRVLEAIFAAGLRLALGQPTLDAALVAVAFALGLGPGAAGAIFAVGRAAGWVAHIQEQRLQATLLRPRARFVPEAKPQTTPG